MRGQVIKSTGSWYQVISEEQTYDARLRGKFKLAGEKVTNPIAVGDWVIMEPEDEQSGTMAIVEIEKRKNYFIRQSTRKTAHAHILASNIDQVVLVATIRQPRTSFGFIDRFLATAESYGIPAHLVINKVDLLDKPKHEELLYEYCEVYDSIGYSISLASAKNQKGLDDVYEALSGKLSLIAGHSGVGKSTLLNALNPDLELRTGDISRYTEKGTHTTTHAQIHALDTASQIIDSPGIKEVGLWNMDKKVISHYLPEMRALLGSCQFHDCTHDHEPNCAVRNAVEAGEIPYTRYRSYLNMIHED